jgi:GxxExxY protein
MALEHGEITEPIIGAAFEVYSILGYGFLEKVYQPAMHVELRSRGLKAEIEEKIKVWYKDELVGDYQADLWVADRVIVELKVARDYQSEDEAQLLNELKATGVRVGLLINFGRTRVEFKRFVF